MRELTDALNNKVEENRFGMKLVVVTYMHLGGQSLKETGAGSKGVFQDNQVLSTELIVLCMYVLATIKRFQNQWFIHINSTADENQSILLHISGDYFQL